MEEERKGQTSQFVHDKINNNMVDRISDMPREILDSILFLLPLKEAVATSVLSKSWRYLWTSRMTLDFDARKTLFGFKDLSQTLQDEERHNYVNWVNRVVEQHISLNIELFRVCFDLDHLFTSSIDNWIQFALKKRGLQVLVLEFLSVYTNIYKHSYTFPRKLLGLEEGFASLQYVGLKSLKVLNFESVDVNGEILEYFLSHCPVLERLSVTLVTSLVNLRVVSPSVRLKYLVLESCLEVESVEIRDTNLVSFIQTGSTINLLISNAPFLVEVSIDGWSATRDFMRNTFTQLSCCLSQLETLIMDLQSVKYNEDDVIPILSNLKHLELTVDVYYEWGLSQLSSFMKASPYLRRLVLKLGLEGSDKKIKLMKAAKCPHNYLKVVEISGYRCKTNDVEYVMYLIENMVALEKLTIDPIDMSKNHPTGVQKSKKYRRKDTRVRRKLRRHAMDLKNRVPSTVELVLYAYTN